MDPRNLPDRNLSPEEPTGRPLPPQASGSPASASSPRPDRQGGINLDMLLDIPVAVSIELGRTQLLLGEILQLGQGSVLELDKLAGEPFEVLVQGRPIGKGEVVVVNEKFGLRLTDVLSPSERIEKLK